MSTQPSRSIGGSAFGSDDGSADATVTSALSAYAAGSGGSADVLAALAGARLLVPVVAVLDDAETDADGVTVDKSSHMATVLTTGKDGRRGLLAFTSTEAMRRWNPSARPVPVPTRRAAESALADGADALVVDLAGPVTFPVDAEALRALAAGWRPVTDDTGGSAWAVTVGLAHPGNVPESVPESVAESGNGPGDAAHATASQRTTGRLRSVGLVVARIRRGFRRPDR